MAFHVRRKETDEIVRRYATRHRVGVTDAVHKAVEDALKRDEDEIAERLKKMRATSDRVSGRPRTGLKADKAFFDEMYED
ncbi:type II toxin-antitoxin system VapB family antitoxin [Brevundimonas sp.]|uniref:type II toxin-antitoxin system VapB family antitoxin n=1 Tax=Brevundimonas sp. TaxID=1871086 RepID=UPI001A1BEDAB|nr:type II toxin-antitoxin system VapB family antitoxin [Brevundimonas sp.]MBJ7486298.1 type II toxin-antitoxin system VapB family antitoxin [Brevundimonas sp.]